MSWFVGKSVHNLKQLINEFSKGTGFHINIQRSFVFLETSHKQKMKRRKQRYSQLHHNRGRYLRINPANEMQLFTLKTETLLRESREM